MEEFRKGERVHIEFDGEIYEDNGSPWVCVQDAKHNFIHKIWSSYAEEIITRRDPEHWPPQPGDIWEANGCEYGVRQSLSDEEAIWVDSLDGYPPCGVCSYATSSLHAFKRLAPHLIRRRNS